MFVRLNLFIVDFVETDVHLIFLSGQNGQPDINLKFVFVLIKGICLKFLNVHLTLRGHHHNILHNSGIKIMMKSTRLQIVCNCSQHHYTVKLTLFVFCLIYINHVSMKSYTLPKYLNITPRVDIFYCLNCFCENYV